MPTILLSIPSVERKVAEVATRELSNRLGVEVRIGKVAIEWFNHLALNDLYLEDENGDILFEANHVVAGFKPFPLLRGKFVFTTVRLFGFSLHLKKNPLDGRLNLQFVIDAFAGRDTLKQSPDIDLRFNSILVRKGNVRYDVPGGEPTPGKFDPKHVDIRNISAKIALKTFTNDSLNAQIRKLSFEERSGIALAKLSADIAGNRDSAFVRDIELKLQQTDFRIDRAGIGLGNVASLDDLLDSAPVTLDIAPSRIYPKELSPFVPAFSHFTDDVELSAEASGYINDMTLKRLTLTYSDKMQFTGSMSLKGITRPEEAYLLGQVNRMHITAEGLSGLVNNFSKDPVVLPRAVRRLGAVDFTGEISGFFDNLVAYGKLSSSIGAIETDLIFGSNREKNIAAYLSGRIFSTELLVSELFEEDNPYGVARFDISIDAQRPVGGHFSGNIKALVNELDYRNYRYENIRLTGRFQRNGFDGVAEVDDPNGLLYAEGMFRNDGKNSIVNCTARLEHFRPDNLNLTDRYDSPEISASLTADFTGNTIDNIEGSLVIDSLDVKTAPASFFLKRFKAEASGDALNRQLTIRSDIMNGELTGAFSFSTLVPGILNTCREYVPALINQKMAGKGETKENNFSLLLTVENTEAVSNTLKSPFAIVERSRITGHYNNQFNKFRLEAFLPKFKLGQTMVESCYLMCENPLNEIDVHLRATNYSRKGVRNYVDFKADAKENLVNTLLTWANNQERLFKADLASSILFVEEENEKGEMGLRTEITLARSPVVINDTLWHVEETGITVENGRINVSNFFFSHDAEYLRLDGTVSRHPEDTLWLDMNRMELSYIFNTLNIPALQFGGKATGTFNMNDLYGKRSLNTLLEIEDFSFNQVTLGQLNLFSEWDDTEQGIFMKGNIYKNDSTWTGVDGYIFPVGKHAGLSLLFEANEIDARFLQPFLAKTAKGLKGYATGHIRLYGSFKDLDLEGQAFVRDGGMGVEFLNTYYTFSDSIYLEPGNIQVKNATVYDMFGNTGRLSLALRHRHFRDVDYQVEVQAGNMLVYDATKRQNPLIYGTVYGSGTSRIRGNERVMNLDISLRTEPKTALSLNLMNGSSAAEYDFITFVDKNKPEAPPDSSARQTAQSLPPPDDEETEMRMNFLIDVTPDATIELVMDPVSGDKIKGYGTGSLQLEYGTKSDLKMYGGFNILSGAYNFSLQQLIYKDFKIREGSVVNFRGNPYNAELDIDAAYSVTANIGDLDQALISESARTNIPVNCILHLDGALNNPSISFDLELPGSNEELERKVKSYVDTEDMMTRQIVYLLVLNKFYTADLTGNTRSNEFGAVASSAISSQISSILSSITDKVQLGTNIRTSQDGFYDTEVEMLLSSQLLDNRLIFNGNFGYKNNPTQKN
ncbi:MAG: translocation/assembly module TamB domain-containing protein, partial [Tannerellaceae bacterium]|nr:translocation/assembly module TamB domain-containing protein [Tannerellaceae bacterium]